MSLFKKGARCNGSGTVYENVTVRTCCAVPLHDVSFTVDNAEKVIVGGPSGSEKSTLPLALMGAHKSSGGRILFSGSELTPQTVGNVRKSVAFIGREPVPGRGKV